MWIAISVYVLVAIIKKEHKLDRSLNEILQILSLNLFEKTQLFSALSLKMTPITTLPCHNPLPLFDF